MAKIGSMELIVILIVAMLAIGPERMPKAARTLGKAVGSFKKYMNDATSDLREASEEFREVTDEIADAQKTVRKAFKDADDEISKTRGEAEEKLNPKKKKKKLWIPILIVLALIIGIVSISLKRMGSQIEMAANTVEIEPVAKRDLSDSISMKGTISGESKTNVMSIASAEVTSVSVQPGDIISEGDPLVTLDTADLEKEIASLGTDITNADAIAQNETAQKKDSLNQAVEDQNTALSRAQSTIDEAQRDLDSTQNNYNSCKDSLDKKNGSLSDAKRELEAAEKELQKASTALESAQTAYTADPDDKKLKKAYDAALKTQTEKQTAYEKAQLSLTNLQTDIASLEAELSTYDSSIKAAQNTLESAKESYADTATSTARTVAAAQNAVNMEQYQSDDSHSLSEKLDNLKKQLDDCTLTAPCSGVVTAVNVSVGDNYAAGTTMITIEDTSALKVIVNVEEANILKLQEGMKAIITTDATGEEEISGTVTRVVRVKNQSTTDAAASGSYSAEISIDSTSLLVGMNAKARIILQEKSSVLAVPYDLIRLDDDGSNYVLVAIGNEDGTATAVRKNIVCGEEVDYYTEITGGDLKEGDLLIYDYNGTVTEGQIFSPEQLYSEQSLTPLTAVDSTESVDDSTESVSDSTETEVTP